MIFVKEGMHLYTLDPLCTVLKEIRLLSSFHLKVDLRSRGKVIRKESVEHKKRGEFSQFADFLLSIGDGKEEQHKNK